jgi:hypothetical protein
MCRQQRLAVAIDVGAVDDENRSSRREVESYRVDFAAAGCSPSQIP